MSCRRLFARAVNVAVVDVLILRWYSGSLVTHFTIHSHYSRRVSSSNCHRKTQHHQNCANHESHACALCLHYSLLPGLPRSAVTSTKHRSSPAHRLAARLAACRTSSLVFRSDPTHICPCKVTSPSRTTVHAWRRHHYPHTCRVILIMRLSRPRQHATLLSTEWQ
jgi:hypothetical protein